MTTGTFVFAIFVCVVLAVGLTVILMLILGPKRGAGSHGAAPKSSRDEREEQREVEDHRRLPYRYMDGGGKFFIHGKGVWTGVRIASLTDELLTSEDLSREVMKRNSSLLALSRNAPRAITCHLRLAHKPVSAAEWAEALIAQAPNPTQFFIDHTRRIAERLGEQGETKIERVLLVRLGDVGRAPKNGAAGAITESVTGVNTHDVSEQEIAAWGQAAEDVHATLGGFGDEPLDRDTLVWLIRKPLHGHLPVPTAPDLGTRAWGRGEFELIADLNGRNGKQFLVLEQEDADGVRAESFTCVMVLKKQPGTIEFRRNTAWIRHALAFRGTVDVSWRFRLLPHKMMKERLTDIHKDINDEFNDMEKAGITPDAMFVKQFEQAVDARDEMALNGDQGGMEGSAQFVLSAPTRAELEKKRKAFEQYMATIEVEVIRPTRMQYRLVEGLMPGDGARLAVAPYTHLTDPDIFGIGLPTSGTEIGDNPKVARDGRTLMGWVGQYLGTTGETGQAVYNDFHVGPARSKPGGIAIVGGSGGGKSSLGLLRFLFDSEAGRTCTAMDPKVDFAQMIYYLAFGHQVTMDGFTDEADRGLLGTPGSRFQPVNRPFWDDTDVIDLQRAHEGAVDPWVVARTVAEGDLLAETALMLFLSPSDWQYMSRHIISALGRVSAQWKSRIADYTMMHGVSAAEAEEFVDRPSLWKVIQQVEAEVEMRRNDGVKDSEMLSLIDTADALNRLKGMPYARLAFSERPVSFGALRKRRTVITMRGFRAPESDNQSQWRPDERMAAGILHLVVEMQSGQLSEGDHPKALYIDESYVVTATSSGRQMVARAIKQGRSYNYVTVLITQQSEDLAQIESAERKSGGGNQFQEFFVFRQKNDDEARQAVPLLGLDPSVYENLLAVQEPALATGWCVMRDVDDRVATIGVDLMYEELWNATETNPTQRAKRQSNHLPLSVNDWTWVGEDPAYGHYVSAPEVAA